jgi:hypothetical protein
VKVTLSQILHCGPQPQKIAIDSESSDLSHHDFGNEGTLPKILSLVDVGDVNFYGR